MAKQQLYTRVPAKLSMFKKELSYDTFAVSKGINEAYVKDNLLKLCDYKQSPVEKEYIFNNDMPNVYMSYFSKKSGELIQTCVSFLPNDFTGEKQGFFAHSLILNDSENCTITKRSDVDLLSASNFLHALPDTKVNFEGDKPVLDYPEREYIVESPTSPAFIAKEYDPDMIKMLIYAFLSFMSKGSKSVNIDLGTTPLKNYSDEALRFLNSFCTIFPFHVRKKLTYVTYTADLKKSPMTFFKVKFVSGLENQIVSLRSSFNFNFNTGTVMGVTAGDPSYKKAKREIRFFYSLLENEERRAKFIEFIERVVPTETEYKGDNLFGIILMYMRIFESIHEEILIPDDDTLFELLTVYEKYRARLTEEERCRILDVMKRYPAQRTVIPQNVFTRAKKIYVGETVECKDVLMGVFLDLMHMEGMREKLFAFVKQVYPTEKAAARHKISENLARVFYGQFLQPQILGLFTEYFGYESPETKVKILEKVVASIRSEQIQDQIIRFLDKYYMQLSPKLRTKVRSELYKELPEEDKLTEKIIGLFEAHFEEEDERTRQRQVRSVFLRIEKAERQKSHKLTDIAFGDLNELRPMARELLCLAMTEEKNVRIFEYLVRRMLGKKKLSCIYDALKTVYSVHTELPSAAEKVLVGGMTGLLSTSRESATLFEYIDLDNSVRVLLDMLGSAEASRVYSELYESYIKKEIKAKLSSAFDVSARKDCLLVVSDFVGNDPYFSSCAEYESIVNVRKIYDLILSGKVFGTLELLCNTELSDSLKADAFTMLSTYFDRMYEEDPIKPDEVTPELALEYFISVGIPYYFGGSADWAAEAFKKCHARIRQLMITVKRSELIKKGKGYKEIKIDESVPAALTLNAALDFCVKISDISQSLAKELYKKDACAMTPLIDLAVSMLYKGGRRHLVKAEKQYSEVDEDITRAIEGAVARYKTANASPVKKLLDSIFKKKKTEEKEEPTEVVTSEAEEENKIKVVFLNENEKEAHTDTDVKETSDTVESFSEIEESETSLISDLPGYVDDETDLEDWETLVKEESEKEYVEPEQILTADADASGETESEGEGEGENDSEEDDTFVPDHNGSSIN